jgi:hypothetical protein
MSDHVERGAQEEQSGTPLTDTENSSSSTVNASGAVP